MNQDAAILARAIVPLLETCRVCGCHGDSCSLFTGERCVWVDRLRTLCSNPDCIAAVERLKKKQKHQQQRNERRAGNAMPHWMKQKRNGANKRRTRKEKGRAA